MEVDEAPGETPLAPGDSREPDLIENEEGDSVTKKSKSSNKKDRDASTSFQHEVGRSSFPITRVQKILKADKVIINALLNRNVIFTRSLLAGASYNRKRGRLRDFSCDSMLLKE